MRKKQEVEQVSLPEKFKLLAADLSLKRPAFCLFTIDKGKIIDIQFRNVDNKTDKKKSHGQLLDEIFKAFLSIYPRNEEVYCVRETEIMLVKVPSERSLSKVVGLMDWAYWNETGKEWYSIYPTSVKKLVTGSGKAEKQEVAEALEKYIGKQEYKCDDESDAAAVGIAWLIQQGQIKETA